MTTTIVFDLDGTLVDTAEDLCGLINPLLVEAGHAPLDRAGAAACLGLGAARFAQRALKLSTGPVLAADLVAALTRRFVAAYETAAPVHSVVYPGVAAALAACRARGWRLGVCTNKPYAAAMTLLRFLDLARWFDGVSGGDSVAARKPDPAHLRDAIARAGGKGGRAIMVGDSETDAACAIAAGVPVVLIAGGYSQEPVETLGADRVVPGFAELMPVLDQMAG